MLLWVFPGWEEAHPSSVFANYTLMPEALMSEIASEVRPHLMNSKNSEEIKNGREFVMALQDTPTQSNYEILMHKIPEYSATFVEFYKFAKRSMFDIHLVLNQCPVHGTPEKVGRLYEIESPKFQVFTNSALHTVYKSLLDATNELRDKTILATFYSTGLRLREIMSLKFGDLNLQKRTISENEESEI